MVTKKRLSKELMRAALNEEIEVRELESDDPIGIDLEPTIAARTTVCGVATELLYCQVGGDMTLWLSRGVACSDVAAANAAIGEYEETPLGQKLCVENEVGNERDSLLLSYSFPRGSEEEDIASLKKIFSLFSDPASSEKLSVLMRCFA